MTAVFADTYYLIALLNSDDKDHQRALRYSRNFRGLLVTTAWVIVETANTMNSPRARRAFLSFYDDLGANSNAVILPPSKQLFDKGVELFRRRDDKEWSLTDCISFVVMAERKIKLSLTGDHHFEQAGFQILMK